MLCINVITNNNKVNIIIILISHRLCVCWIVYFNCDGKTKHYKPVETKYREKILDIWIYLLTAIG